MCANRIRLITSGTWHFFPQKRKNMCSVGSYAHRSTAHRWIDPNFESLKTWPREHPGSNQAWAQTWVMGFCQAVFVLLTTLQLSIKAGLPVIIWHGMGEKYRWLIYYCLQVIMLPPQQQFTWEKQSRKCIQVEQLRVSKSVTPNSK